MGRIVDKPILVLTEDPEKDMSLLSVVPPDGWDLDRTLAWVREHQPAIHERFGPGHVTTDPDEVKMEYYGGSSLN